MIEIFCGEECAFSGELDHIPRDGENILIQCDKTGEETEYIVDTIRHDIGKDWNRVLIDVVELIKILE